MGSSAEPGADAAAPPALSTRRPSTPSNRTETQRAKAWAEAEASAGAGAEASAEAWAEAETSRAMGVEERIAALRGDALRDELKRVLRTQTG